MKKILLLILMLSISAGSVTKLKGYGNVYAHPRINQVIVDEFKKRVPNYIQQFTKFKKFENYYFGLDLTSLKGTGVKASGQFNITEGEMTMTGREWIKHGGYSADEPEIPAALRHFYDPILSYQGKLYLTDVAPDIVNPCIDAVHWAFNGADLGGNNQWTWKKGKDYMKQALEAGSELKASEYLAKALRCLGEVLHNTGDMGLPAHVRNDAHGGYRGVGGADPYESLYMYDSTAKFGAEKADPKLAEFFRSSENAQKINEKLGAFTNELFFSHETISGTGVKAYHSVNGFADYPSPKLEQFTYKPETFGYYKIFPSNREVLMCVDQSLFLGYMSTNFRSFPRVDLKCIASQATELIPDIVEAGINVIRTFIPELVISVSADAKDGKVTGSVTHRTDAEYTSQILYSGEVRFWVNGKLSDQIIKSSNGSFSGNLSGLKKGDKIRAKVSFADIVVSSPETLATESGGGTDTKDSENFEYSWTYQGSYWPQTQCNFGVKGTIETTGGTITSIKSEPFGNVYITLSKSGVAFKITYSSSAIFPKTEFDTTGRNIYGGKTVFKITGPANFSNSTNGFSKYYFVNGASIEYSASDTGSIYTDTFYDTSLEEFDKDGKSMEKNTGPSTLPLIKVHIQ